MNPFENLEDPLGPPAGDALGAVKQRVRRRRVRRRTAAAAGGIALAVAIAASANALAPGGHEAVSVSNTPTTLAPSTTTNPSSRTSTSVTTPGSTRPTTTVPTPSPTVTIGHWTGREPRIIYFSGDANDIATNLRWSRWTADGAVATGTWNFLSCDPNCAQGSATPYPVTITLSDVVNGQFTKLVEQTSGPHGYTQTFTPPFGLGACTNDSIESCANFDTVSTLPPEPSDLWTGRALRIDGTSLGAVKVGMSLDEAQLAAGIVFDASGDGVHYPTKLVNAPDLFVNLNGGGGTVNCVGAAGVPQKPGATTVTTPEGFRLGESVARLRAVYGDRLTHIPDPVRGIEARDGYVVKEGSSYLAFSDAKGIVWGIAAGPTGSDGKPLTPSSCIY